MSDRVIVFIDGPHAGRYLLRYDPDFGDGRGLVESTPVLDEAQKFPTSAAAWEEWRRPSTARPVRLDGKPNRPMSAYTITITPADGEIGLP